MHRSIVFLVGIVLFPWVSLAAAPEKQKPDQVGPHIVAHREEKVTVVFTVRIIHSGTKPLQDPLIRMRLPIDTPHQSVDALEIEGRPQRVSDRWKEPVLAYHLPRLESGQILTGRWTADCRIRELRWNLNGTRDNRVPPLSADDRSL